MSMAALRRRRIIQAADDEGVDFAFFNPTGSDGSTVIFTAPLIPGMLTLEQFNAGYGRFEADGTEISVHASDLFGKHPEDNSLRSLRFNTTRSAVESASRIKFYKNRLRTLDALSRAPDTRAFWQAPITLLPTSAEYLCDTDMCFGPLVARGTEGALHEDYATIKSLHAAWLNSAWDLTGPQGFPPGTTYDHGLALAMEWCETANPELWWRAMQHTDLLMDLATPSNDAIANPDVEWGVEWDTGMLREWRRHLHTVAWGYAATGHPQFRRTVLATMALWTRWVNPGFRLVTDDWDIATTETRGALAPLNSLVLGLFLEPGEEPVSSLHASEDWQARLDSFLDYCASRIRPAMAPQPWLGGLVLSEKDVGDGNLPTFQTAIAASDFIDAFRLVYKYSTDRSALVQWVRNICDIAIAQSRPLDASLGFPGATAMPYLSEDPATIGETLFTADNILQLMFGKAFGFLALHDNDADRITQMQTLFVRSGNVSTFLGGSIWKRVGEQTLWSNPGMGYHRKMLQAA